jgi:hypothetical protein
LKSSCCSRGKQITRKWVNKKVKKGISKDEEKQSKKNGICVSFVVGDGLWAERGKSDTPAGAGTGA